MLLLFDIDVLFVNMLLSLYGWWVLSFFDVMMVVENGVLSWWWVLSVFVEIVLVKCCGELCVVVMLRVGSIVVLLGELFVCVSDVVR